VSGRPEVFALSFAIESKDSNLCSVAPSRLKREHVSSATESEDVTVTVSNYRIALLPGDGIGPEVTSSARDLLVAITTLDPSLVFQTEEFAWNAEQYLSTGAMMPIDGLATLAQFDAIFLGAIGDKRVPDHISLRQIIFAIRQGFNQYVNLRPVKLLGGVATPLSGRGPEDLDMVIVRENSEGEYSGLGGTLFPGSDDEVALQTSVFSRRGVERILRYAFELARSEGRPLSSVSKGNALNFTGVLWDDLFSEISAEYPDVPSNNLLVDAAALHLVQHPEKFGVVVASNLFGDILSDLGAALVGGLGFAASANLNPERAFPSMFEPVHGSAPDIAGQNVANPVASLWAVGMMLAHLGRGDWEDAIVAAIECVLVDGIVRTPDLGGSSTTSEMTTAIINALKAPSA
jgi:tartrate dehydrogenase/decarboxylase/D-malate dehydrogenase